MPKAITGRTSARSHSTMPWSRPLRRRGRVVPLVLLHPVFAAARSSTLSAHRHLQSNAMDYSGPEVCLSTRLAAFRPPLRIRSLWMLYLRRQHVVSTIRKTCCHQDSASPTRPLTIRPWFAAVLAYSTTTRKETFWATASTRKDMYHGRSQFRSPGSTMLYRRSIPLLAPLRYQVPAPFP